jgi:hypothetical protein
VSPSLVGRVHLVGPLRRSILSSPDATARVAADSTTARLAGRAPKERMTRGTGSPVGEESNVSKSGSCHGVGMAM